MRFSILATSLSLLLASTLGMATETRQADQINGIWETEGGTYIQIYRQDDQYLGRLVGSEDDKTIRDKSQDSGDHKGPSIMGHDIVHGLHYKGDHEYGDGRVFNPRNGKEYKANAELEDPETLTARAYIGISLIGKDEKWRRVDAQTPHVKQELLHKPQSADARSGTEQP